MMRNIHRLLAAAADPNIRQAMNDEEIYLQPIEDRDTAIMQRDKELAENHSVILDFARHLKASGQSVEQIVALTKLTEEEIKDL